jgi:hypothetical protein
MDKIDAIGRTATPQRVNAKTGSGVDPVVSAPNRHLSDRAEFSQGARLLSRLQQLPGVRQDLVDRVRTQIVAEDYASDEKVHAALDEMIEDLEELPG